jgi:lipoprotein-releasing system ATP-binding protein
MIISCKNIKKSYSFGKNDLQVLKGVSLEIKKAEVIAIVGPSGAGKSTLLHILGLLDRPNSGELLLDGIDVTKFNDEKLSRIRNEKIGFIFQFHHLLPEFSAIENIMMPALIARKNANQCKENAQKLLSEVGLLERKDHKPSELSGGEQQRVAIARSLMNNPQIIFADEPTGNLDSENALSIHSLIFELRNKYNQSFVIVTHNKDLAAQADRILTMCDGHL